MNNHEPEPERLLYYCILLTAFPPWTRTPVILLYTTYSIPTLNQNACYIIVYYLQHSHPEPERLLYYCILLPAFPPWTRTPVILLYTTYSIPTLNQNACSIMLYYLQHPHPDPERLLYYCILLTAFPPWTRTPVILLYTTCSIPTLNQNACYIIVYYFQHSHPEPERQLYYCILLTAFPPWTRMPVVLCYTTYSIPTLIQNACYIIVYYLQHSHPEPERLLYYCILLTAFPAWTRTPGLGMKKLCSTMGWSKMERSLWVTYSITSTDASTSGIASFLTWLTLARSHVQSRNQNLRLVPQIGPQNPRSV